MLDDAAAGGDQGHREAGTGAPPLLAASGAVDLIDDPLTIPDWLRRKS